LIPTPRPLSTVLTPSGNTKGRTRVSRVDGRRGCFADHWIIDTVAIRDNDDVDLFEIPILASADGYYAVPTSDKSGLARPRILNLKDYTREGTTAQFPLLAYEACGISAGAICP
jgi:hypothetical protein